MDHTIERVRAASELSAAIAHIHTAQENIRGSKASYIVPQLADLVGELVYFHRQLLELPPKATPAACEFERGDHLGQPELPF